MYYGAQMMGLFCRIQSLLQGSFAKYSMTILPQFPFHLNLQYQSPTSLSLVSFQRNVTKVTRRTRSSIEIESRNNETPNAIGCIYMQRHSLTERLNKHVQIDRHVNIHREIVPIERENKYVQIYRKISIYRETVPVERQTTEWRRVIGCLKLQVIFCKRATEYRALWRKMTCRDKASYDSTPPCTLLDHTLQQTATHCNTLQHTATHCNTLQHTATHRHRDCIEGQSLWRDSVGMEKNRFYSEFE